MGLLKKFFRSLEDPSTPLSDPSAWLYDALGMQATDAGISISPASALKFAAVSACINIIAQPLAQVPFSVMRFDGKRREVAIDRPEYWLLHNEPNAKHSSYVWRSTLFAQLLSYGNTYHELIRDGSNKVREIRPLLPGTVAVLDHPSEYKFVYEITRRNGVRDRVDGEDVGHVPCLSLTGDVGLSPITQHRQAIALGLAAEKAGAATFGNGTRLSGILVSKKTLTEQQEKKLLASWKEAYGGSQNAGKTALMQGDLDWKSIGMTLEDAQYMLIRDHQVADVARMYRVPAQMLGVKDSNPTYASAEQFFKAFVTLVLAPWATAIEQEFNRKLFPGNPTLYCKLDLRALLRGDSEARAKFYKVMTDMGVFSINDVLAAEDMNPIEQGDERFISTTMQPLEKALAGATDEGAGDTEAVDDGNPSSDEATPTDEAARSAHSRWLADVVSRVSKWERKDGAKIADALLPVFDSLSANLPAERQSTVARYCLELAPNLPPAGNLDQARAVVDQFLS